MQKSADDSALRSLAFVESEQVWLLYDESSKLWWSGPSDIAEMYKAEWKNAEVRCGL